MLKSSPSGSTRAKTDSRSKVYEKSPMFGTNHPIKASFSKGMYGGENEVLKRQGKESNSTNGTHTGRSLREFSFGG